jgi:hypothetical protein
MLTEKIKMLMIPRQTLIYMMVCLSGLMIIVLIGIVPNFISLHTLDRRMRDVKVRVDEQDKLNPIYQMLDKKIRLKQPKALPFPAVEKLQRKSIDSFSETFREMAKRAGMDLTYISPDIGSLSDDSASLVVNAVIRGGFFNFRKLLIDLGKVPYSEQVEEIQIEQNQDAVEFRMKIRLALA